MVTYYSLSMDFCFSPTACRLMYQPLFHALHKAAGSRTYFKTNSDVNPLHQIQISSMIHRSVMDDLVKGVLRLKLTLELSRLQIYFPVVFFSVWNNSSLVTQICLIVQKQMRNSPNFSVLSYVQIYAHYDIKMRNTQRNNLVDYFVQKAFGTFPCLDNFHTYYGLAYDKPVMICISATSYISHFSFMARLFYTWHKRTFGGLESLENSCDLELTE
jgi:hypothetical protein